ncbi:FadR/GntR family transcriptional regulator [Propionibacteriaceae bacterium Y1700]|uniref:FadR/GntR family transcriptional regulator n=1 Tax=Microlunatus sp. Y1700 TaxID=3418487 RepID=UPI003DA70984
MAETLQARIKDYILARRLRPGDLLPNEPTLMAELGVGRHPLREAIKGLQAIGIVTIRPGTGTFVADLTFDALEAGVGFMLSRAVAEQDFQRIGKTLQVREAIEIGLTRRVFDQVTHDQLDHLSALVDEMTRRAEADEKLGEVDFAFHLALYETLDNPLVTELISVFFRTMETTKEWDGYPPPDPMERAGWHRDLVQALRDGDTDAYGAAMAVHFASIDDEFPTGPA